MSYFSYFPNCPLVEGASQSAFYDLRNSAIIRFPSELLPKLRALKDAKRADIEASVLYPDLGELASGLVGLGVAAYTSRKSPWIEIVRSESAVHSMPTHALIDVGAKHHDYHMMFEELSAVGCEFVQIRIFRLFLEEDVIQEISVAAKSASLRGVELIVPFRTLEDRSWVARSLERSPRISGITYHSAPISSRDCDVMLETGQHIRFDARRFRESDDCGSITQQAICAPTVSNFRKLQVSNGCHAGKVGIDSDGHIRNCPSASKSFGLLGKTPLGEVVLGSHFQATWSITKDAIDGCKDCEFRYACTDCRVFTDGPDVATAKPSKCNYDPYTGSWKSNEQC